MCIGEYEINKTSLILTRTGAKKEQGTKLAVKRLLDVIPCRKNDLLFSADMIYMENEEIDSITVKPKSN